jgi:hypothetical protein
VVSCKCRFAIEVCGVADGAVTMLCSSLMILLLMKNSPPIRYRASFSRLRLYQEAYVVRREKKHGNTNIAHNGEKVNQPQVECNQL